jgi:hypothetical protein
MSRTGHKVLAPYTHIQIKQNNRQIIILYYFLSLMIRVLKNAINTHTATQFQNVYAIPTLNSVFKDHITAKGNIIVIKTPIMNIPRAKNIFDIVLL